jgi:hypothetical protein
MTHIYYFALNSRQATKEIDGRSLYDKGKNFLAVN